MRRRSGREEPEAAGQLEEVQPEAHPPGASSEGRAATCASPPQAQAKEAEVQQPAGPRAAAQGRTRHAKPMQGAANPAAVHATKGGAARHSAASSEHHQQQQEEEQGQASPGRAPKRRRHNPMRGAAPVPPSSAPSPDEHTQEGPLSLLPGDVLDHMVSLLAAEEGGSCIRSTCSWLRSIFDRCNTRLVLRGTAGQQLPGSFPARLLNLVRYSPCVISLTLEGGAECVTWPQVLEAGGPGLLRRLERLTLTHRAPALYLEAVAACCRLQQLRLHGLQQTALRLQPLAACGGTLRHLAIHGCSSVRDFTPLAACAVLQHLALASCFHLVDLTPLAACAALQRLGFAACSRLADLTSPP